MIRRFPQIFSMRTVQYASTAFRAHVGRPHHLELDPVEAVVVHEPVVFGRDADLDQGGGDFF